MMVLFLWLAWMLLPAPHRYTLTIYLTLAARAHIHWDYVLHAVGVVVVVIVAVVVVVAAVLHLL